MTGRALPRLAVDLDGSGNVLGARALHDDENPGPTEFEYVPRIDDDFEAYRAYMATLEAENARLRARLAEWAA